MYYFTSQYEQFFIELKNWTLLTKYHILTIINFNNNNNNNNNNNTNTNNNNNNNNNVYLFHQNDKLLYGCNVTANQHISIYSGVCVLVYKL